MIKENTYTKQVNIYISLKYKIGIVHGSNNIIYILEYLKINMKYKNWNNLLLRRND